MKEETVRQTGVEENEEENRTKRMICTDTCFNYLFILFSFFMILE